MLVYQGLEIFCLLSKGLDNSRVVDLNVDQLSPVKSLHLESAPSTDEILRFFSSVDLRFSYKFAISWGS